MPRTPRARHSHATLPDEVSRRVCEWCPPRRASTQCRAHLHWLRDFSTLDALKQHLYVHLTPSLEGRDYTETMLQGILSWWTGIHQDFCRDMDDTGRPLQVWEAWCMAQARPPCRTVGALHARLAAAGDGAPAVQP